MSDGDAIAHGPQTKENESVAQACSDAGIHRAPEPASAPCEPDLRQHHDDTCHLSSAPPPTTSNAISSNALSSRDNADLFWAARPSKEFDTLARAATSGMAHGSRVLADRHNFPRGNGSYGYFSGTLPWARESTDQRRGHSAECPPEPRVSQERRSCSRAASGAYPQHAFVSPTVQQTNEIVRQAMKSAPEREETAQEYAQRVWASVLREASSGLASYLDVSAADDGPGLSLLAVHRSHGASTSTCNTLAGLSAISNSACSSLTASSGSAGAALSAGEVAAKAVFET